MQDAIGVECCVRVGWLGLTGYPWLRRMAGWRLPFSFSSDSSTGRQTEQEQKTGVTQAAGSSALVIFRWQRRGIKLGFPRRGLFFGYFPSWLWLGGG
jgi:hypothetical protein